MSDETSDLATLRQQLDEIDDQIVELLNKRANLALEVKTAKERDRVHVYAPERERQILERVAAQAAAGPFPMRSLERIFLNILSATRSLVGDISVSFLGPELSLAHHAGIAQFGEHVKFTPAHGTDEVFARVERGDATFGVVPARTNSVGLVTDTFDRLMESKLQIVAEIEIKDRLALFSGAGSLQNVATVYGIPDHFDRARTWLSANLPKTVRAVTEDLPRVMDKLTEGSPVALLAMDRVAENLGQQPLATGIEGGLATDARCIVVGDRQPSPSDRDKTSLLCSIPDRAGALRDILEPFSKHGVTLLKIESHPLRNRAWDFVFFIDLAGHQQEDQPKAAIEELSALCPYVKVLGSYPLVCHS